MRVFVSQLEHSALALLLVCMRNLVNLLSQYGGNVFVVTLRNLRPISTTRPTVRSSALLFGTTTNGTVLPRTVGLHFQQLPSDLHVTLPTVVPHKKMSVPPWLFFKTTFDFSLTKYGKSTTSAELLTEAFCGSDI
jgi:hypothetical protein